MNKTRSTWLFCTALLLAALAVAEQSGRPAGLTLANFQFGPHNRWAFSHMREIIPTANIAHDPARVLDLDADREPVGQFQLDFQGRRQHWQAIAERHFIDGVLVLKNGKIVFEEYYGQLGPARPHLMMSVTKSVVGLLAGKLAAEGVVDLDKPVAAYVPELAASGWGPDSLRLLLDMRDGSAYTEDYEDMSSSVRLQDCAVAWTDADYCPEDGPRGGYAFYPTIGRNEDNLGRFVYKSGSTDVIGWVLEAASGEPLAELISTRIWQPMGAEFDANITVDQSGFVLGDGGMSASLRDLGRFGLLVLNNGEALGKQVVPAAFIEDIHQQAGDPDWPYAGEPGADEPYYRSFWWGKGNAERDVLGLGIHGQFLQVAPKAGIVVAIFSSWPRADGAGQDAGGDTGPGWDPIYALGDALVRYFR